MPTELESVTTLLAAYMAAEATILTGQSYTIGNRSLTRAHLSEVVRERKNLEARKKGLEGGGIKVRPVVHRDS